MSHTHTIFKSSQLLSIALAALLGCATTGRDAKPSDAQITMKVGKRLRRDPEVDRFRIDVDTIERVVYLRGEVRNEQAKREAEHLAKTTKGVIRVVNELEVSDEPYGAGAAFDDRWIVTMVESKLARDPTVRSRNVDVDSMRGVVTLSGIVETERAKEQAEYVARTVDGVNEIVNQLQIEQKGASQSPQPGDQGAQPGQQDDGQQDMQGNQQDDSPGQTTSSPSGK
jgi:hyperosmotically inducible protein